MDAVSRREGKGRLPDGSNVDVLRPCGAVCIHGGRVLSISHPDVELVKVGSCSFCQTGVRPATSPGFSVWVENLALGTKTVLWYPKRSVVSYPTDL